MTRTQALRAAKRNRISKANAAMLRAFEPLPVLPGTMTYVGSLLPGETLQNAVHRLGIGRPARLDG